MFPWGSGTPRAFVNRCSFPPGGRSRSHLIYYLRKRSINKEKSGKRKTSRWENGLKQRRQRKGKHCTGTAVPVPRKKPQQKAKSSGGGVSVDGQNRPKRPTRKTSSPDETNTKKRKERGGHKWTCILQDPKKKI